MTISTFKMSMLKIKSELFATTQSEVISSKKLRNSKSSLSKSLLKSEMMGKKFLMSFQQRQMSISNGLFTIF